MSLYSRVPTRSGKREKVGNFVKPVPGPEKVLIFVISMKNREKPGKSTKLLGMKQEFRTIIIYGLRPPFFR